MVIPILLVQLRKNLDENFKINSSIFEAKENITIWSHFSKRLLYAGLV